MVSAKNILLVSKIIGQSVCQFSSGVLFVSISGKNFLNHKKLFGVLEGCAL